MHPHAFTLVPFVCIHYRWLHSLPYMAMHRGTHSVQTTFTYHSLNQMCVNAVAAPPLGGTPTPQPTPNLPTSNPPNPPHGNDNACALNVVACVYMRLHAMQMHLNAVTAPPLGGNNPPTSPNLPAHTNATACALHAVACKQMRLHAMRMHLNAVTAPRLGAPHARE